MASNRAFRDKHRTEDSDDDHESGECSDDNSGPTNASKRPRPDLIDELPSANRFNVWSDVLTDQTLSAQLTSDVDVQQTQSANRVEREVESYNAPNTSTAYPSNRFSRPPGFRANRGDGRNRGGPKDRGHHHQQQHQQQDQHCHPSSSAVAERLDAEIDAYRLTGGKRGSSPLSDASSTNASSTTNPAPVELLVGDMEDSNDAHPKTAPPPPSPTDLTDDDLFGNQFFDDSVEEMGVKQHSTAVRTGDQQQFLRPPGQNADGRIRGQHTRGRGGHFGSYRGNRGRGTSRDTSNHNGWGSRGVKRALSPGGRGGGTRGRGHFDPALATVTAGYSLENLQSVAFPEGLTPEELGMKMAEALGETNQEMTVKAVTSVGEQKALQLFNETRDVEGVGGLMINDGSRRRTPGGVFLFLLRKDETIAKEVKDKIFETGKEQKRVYKKAKYRHKNAQQSTSFEDTLKQTRMAMERRKRKCESDDNVDALPKVADMQQEDDDHRKERDDGDLSGEEECMESADA